MPIFRLILQIGFYSLFCIFVHALDIISVVQIQGRYPYIMGISKGAKCLWVEKLQFSTFHLYLGNYKMGTWIQSF